MANIELIALAKESQHEDVTPLLRALRERHPAYLQTAWRELLAGETCGGTKTIEILVETDFLRRVGELPPMLVENLLPDRSLFLLAGKPKAGKSYLALDMADAICRGGMMWGQYRINRSGPVVYFGMEDGDNEIARRLQERRRARIGEGNVEGEGRLHICAQRFTASNPESLVELRELLAPIAPSLVIVDTAAEALGIKNWYDRGEITEKVAGLRELAHGLCTILLVAHNRKAEGDQGDEIAGSNAFTGAVDGWLSCWKAQALPSGNRRLWLRMEGRGGVRGETTIEMDTRTLLFGRPTAEQATEQEGNGSGCAGVGAEQIEFIRRAILDYGGKATVRQISDYGEWPYSTAQRYVQGLVKAGMARDTGEKQMPAGGGKPMNVFAWNSDDEA